MNTFESIDYLYNDAEQCKPSLLKKPESLNYKLVFPQAMADAGELTPGGYLAMFKINGVMVEGRVKAKTKKCIIFDADGDERVRQIGECTTKPTQTEREQALEKCMSVEGLRARDGAKEDYGSLYDAGLLKC